MEKTLAELIAFNSIQFKNEFYVGKFQYACEKVKRKEITPIFEKFSELMEDKRIELASVDDKGNILREGTAYKFTPDNERKLNEYARNLNKQKHEIKGHYVEPKNIPVGLTVTLIEMLSGFVIDPAVAEEMIEAFDKEVTDETQK